MANHTTHPAWMDDELVRNIPKTKLDFLSKIFSENHGKSQRELMMNLLPMVKEAKDQGLTLTNQEMKAAIEAIKKYSSKEELSKMESILSKNQKKSG